MNASDAKPTLFSELVTLTLIALSLAAIAGVFFLWGRSDNGFMRRKADLLMAKLDEVAAQRSDQKGLNLYASYVQEADATKRLLTCQLDKATWLEIAQQYCLAECSLVSMGDSARIPEFTDFCQSLSKAPDPRMREIGESAQFAIQFERQYLFCQHKRIVLDLLELAEGPENGEPGQQFAERIRQQQKLNWRIAGIYRDLQTFADKVPSTGSLKPVWDTLARQALDVEAKIPRDAASEIFEDWLAETKSLVARYPQNMDICRGIIQSHDRLTSLRCYDEAKQLLVAALDQYQANESGDSNPHVAEMIDRRSASQIDLDHWKNFAQEKPGESDRIIEPLKQGAQKLNDQMLVSERIADQFLAVAQTLEGKQQYASAAQLRDALIEVLGNHERVGQRLKNFCAASSKRAAMVGQPFALPSGLSVAKPLDAAIFKDHVTAVVFFSLHDDASYDTMLKLEQMFTRNQAGGFRLVGINVDTDMQAAQSLAADPGMKWPVVVAAGLDATGNNPLAVEYGIDQTPYLILVDQKGTIVDVALTVPDMRSRAEKLLPKAQTPARRGLE